MKVFGVISTATLLLLLGAAVPAFAQDDHHEEAAKPAKQEEPAKPVQPEKQPKPVKQEAQPKPEKQAAPEKQDAKPVKQETPAKPEAQTKPMKQAAPAKQEAQAKPAKQTGKTAGQRPQRTAAEVQRQKSVPALRLSARGSGRIPDDRYSANFGSEHVFQIGSPSMVDGYSRFQYGGYWFGFVQPWPSGWYYTDDVYVVYIGDGYYLCNPYYPGAQINISVVL
jgi:hypothetical protein